MKKIAINIWDFVGKVFRFISGPLIVIWLFGMGIQFIRSVLQQDYTMLQIYGQIALTLFGFTLIAGIFEKNKEHSKIEKKLFDSSLYFLTTSISFYFMYALSSVFTKEMTPMDDIASAIVVSSFSVAMFIGYYGIILGFVNLYRILVDYRVALDEN